MKIPLLFFTIDLTCPVIQALIALAIVGLLTIVAVIKFFNYITCGYCRGRENMKGKTVIVTGATGGIGLETTRELAKRGAKVIMACRNPDMAEKVRAKIVKSTNNENILVKKLDLNSQKSIRAFAEDINRTVQKLDVLIHNAGTAENKIKMTEDNLETTMATNHFGPFLLTHLLIDLLKRSSPSRIVIVASELYRLASVDLNNINPTSSWFPPWIYYVSKYANIYFARELARRLDGTKVTVNFLHPGMIDTGIWRNTPAYAAWALNLVVKCFFKTPEQGCQTSVYLATSDEVENVTGKYFMDCKESSLSSNAQDDNKAKKLWELSEKLAGLKESDPKI